MNDDTYWRAQWAILECEENRHRTDDCGRIANLTLDVLLRLKC